MASALPYAPVLDRTGLGAAFLTAYTGALSSGWANSLAFMNTVDSESVAYPYLGPPPMLTARRGDKPRVKDMAAYKYTLTNEEYDASTIVYDLDLRRDKLGMIRNRLAGWGVRAAEHWDDLISTLITSGTSGTGYDGVAFFAATHPESGSSQSNLLTGSNYTALSDVTTATAPTTAEAAATLPFLVGHFHSLKDADGQYINGGVRNITIMVGTVSLFAAYQGAVSLANLTSGATNPVAGLVAGGYSLKVVLNPRLSAQTDDVYLFASDGRNQPFIAQEEVPLSLESTTEDGDLYRIEKKYQFTARAVRAAGYGFWTSAIMATLS